MEDMQVDNVPCEPLAELASDNMLGDLFTAPLMDSTFGVTNSIINYTGKNNIILSGRKMVPSLDALESVDQKKIIRLPKKVHPAGGEDHRE